MIALAAVLTFVLTAVMTMAGVGAAFVLIPVFLALGVALHTAMATALLVNAVAMSVASVTFVRKRLVVWPLVLPMLALALAVIASPKRAAASASFVVLFASLSGFLAHAIVAQIGLPLLATTTVASAAGAALGAWLASEKLRCTGQAHHRHRADRRGRQDRLGPVVIELDPSA